MKRFKLKKIPKRNQPVTTLLVDLKYLAYRMRYTQGAQLTYNEVNTTILFGVLSSLLSAAKKFEINKCVICADIDSDEKSIRKEEYPVYKMKKYTQPLSEYDMKLNVIFKEEYNNLIETFERIGFGANYLERYEADDVISLYCEKYKNKENIIILTRDEDMYQCLDKQVIQYSPDDKIKKTDKWFMKEYGIDPLDWNMIKAMAGCKSDNVLGIKGIGEGIALKYMKEEATPNQIKKIKDNWDTVKECLQVVTLPHPNLQNGFKFDFTPSDLDMEKFITFSQKNGFRSFIDSQHDFKHYFSSND